MKGMDKQGRQIDGLNYLRQRIDDAFNTPIGTLIMERGYGSRLHEFVDRNVDENFRVDLINEVARIFKDPINGLSDCDFKAVSVIPKDKNIYLNVEVVFDGETASIEGLSYERNRSE